MHWIFRVVGYLLILPAVVAIVWTFSVTADCQDECHGNVVYFAICVLLALPAAVGAILLLVTPRFKDRLPRRADG